MDASNTTAADEAPDPVIEAYKSGIDRASIRKNLGLTVEERFIQLMELQAFVAELRRAGAAARERTPR